MRFVKLTIAHSKHPMIGCCWSNLYKYKSWMAGELSTHYVLVDKPCGLVCNTYIITRPPESGYLCGNILWVTKGSPERAGLRWSTHYCHPKLSDIAIQISRRRLFYFYTLLFNDFMSFPAKVYEINMYLLLYLSLKIKVQEYTKLHYNAMLLMWCYNPFWHHNRLHCDVIMSFHCSVMSFMHYHCLEQCC